jgi:hypothetical protein
MTNSYVTQLLPWRDINSNNAAPTPNMGDTPLNINRHGVSERFPDNPGDRSPTCHTLCMLTDCPPEKRGVAYLLAPPLLQMQKLGLYVLGGAEAVFLRVATRAAP